MKTKPKNEVKPKIGDKFLVIYSKYEDEMLDIVTVKDLYSHYFRASGNYCNWNFKYDDLTSYSFNVIIAKLAPLCPAIEILYGKGE